MILTQIPITDQNYIAAERYWSVILQRKKDENQEIEALLEHEDIIKNSILLGNVMKSYFIFNKIRFQFIEKQLGQKQNFKHKYLQIEGNKRIHLISNLCNSEIKDYFTCKLNKNSFECDESYGIGEYWFSFVNLNESVINIGKIDYQNVLICSILRREGESSIRGIWKEDTYEIPVTVLQELEDYNNVR